MLLLKGQTTQTHIWEEIFTIHGQNHFSYLHLLCLLKEYSTGLRLYLTLPSDFTALTKKHPHRETLSCWRMNETTLTELCDTSKFFWVTKRSNFDFGWSVWVKCWNSHASDTKQWSWADPDGRAGLGDAVRAGQLRSQRGQPAAPLGLNDPPEPTPGAAGIPGLRDRQLATRQCRERAAAAPETSQSSAKHSSKENIEWANGI